MNSIGLSSLLSIPVKDRGIYSERKERRGKEFDVTDSGEVLLQRKPLSSFMAR
jgi:hypothetical protein